MKTDYSALDLVMLASIVIAFVGLHAFVITRCIIITVRTRRQWRHLDRCREANLRMRHIQAEDIEDTIRDSFDDFD